MKLNEKHNHINEHVGVKLYKKLEESRKLINKYFK